MENWAELPGDLGQKRDLELVQRIVRKVKEMREKRKASVTYKIFKAKSLQKAMRGKQIQALSMLMSQSTGWSTDID